VKKTEHGYRVLARKWRPQQFKDVVGQEHVTTTLENAIKKGRVAHAYIFTGPRGIGKTSTARILSKALNCAEGPTTTPCDKCPSCRGIIEGNSMDVLEIDGASNRGIDQIRELRENVKFAPGAAPYKIYIIDEVHQITTEAFNALLKTLEEPPSHVKFIFATTEPRRVPATILSRCQRFDMRSISADEIVERLRRVAAAEKIKVDEKACFAIARYAQGSMRDAQSILDQVVSFTDGDIGEQEVISMLGLVEESVFRDITAALFEGDCSKGLCIIADVAEKGKDLSLFLADWIAYLRAIMFAQILGADANIDGVSSEAWSGITRQSEDVTKEQLLFMLDVLVAAEQQMRWVLSPRVQLELSFIKAARAKERVAIGEILRKIKALEERLGGTGMGRDDKAVENGARAPRRGAAAPAPGRTVRNPKPAAPRDESRRTAVGIAEAPAHFYEKDTSAAGDGAEVDDTSLFNRVLDVWQEVVDRAVILKPLLKSYFIEGKPHRCENGVVTVEFPDDCVFQCESLEQPRNKQLISKMLSERLRCNVMVRFKLREGEEKTGETGAVKPSKKDIRNLKRNHLIQSALEMFRAQVIEVKS
jgi:DNA polymerase-3 subunit gamma/tau